MSSKTIRKDSLQNIPLSYASCSIGCTDDDTLPRKLEAISKAGFTAIELAFPDIVSYASQKLGRQIASDDYTQLVDIAKDIRKLCEEKRLEIMMLQPFSNFEGWSRDSKERADAFKRADGWIAVMRALGTDMLQVWSRPCRGHRLQKLTETGWINRHAFGLSVGHPRKYHHRPALASGQARATQHATSLRKLVLVHPRPYLEGRLVHRESRGPSKYRAVSGYLPDCWVRMGRSDHFHGESQRSAGRNAECAVRRQHD